MKAKKQVLIDTATQPEQLESKKAKNQAQLDTVKAKNESLLEAASLQEQLNALRAKKQAHEKKIAALWETVKYVGCRCVIDTKADECRMESIETGKMIAKITYIKTCSQDCARWYKDSVMRGLCGSKKFLKASADSLTAEKQALANTLKRENEIKEKLRSLNQ